MGISKAVTTTARSKFVVPSAGKMFRSSIAKNDEALCFILNKGYIESDSLFTLQDLVNKVSDIAEFVIVGTIQGVVVDGVTVYRQRLFFRSIVKLLKLLHSFGMRFELDTGFHITINNIMNCINELQYLERYAAKFDETIDTWLTNCCIVHLNNLMTEMGVYNPYEQVTNRILAGRVGYLNRAPFLGGSYSIDTHSSSLVLLELPLSDRRMYTVNPDRVDQLIYGYTSSNILKDLKEGVL